MSLVKRFRDGIADGYVLGPVRVATSALLGWHALQAAEQLGRVGYFGDGFHIATLPESLVPSAKAYGLAVAARVCLAVLAALGVWARPALGLGSVLGVWHLLCDRNQFHHNRYSLFCFAFLLAFTPCDRSWRLAGERDVPEPRTGPFWAVYVAQAQVALIYLASGGAKLVDADWRDGVVVAERVLRAAPYARLHGVPDRLLQWLAQPDTASALAKGAIMTELLLCSALLLRPTRIIALWWGLWFHIVIQLVANVETFSILMLAMYGLFVTPDFQARKLRYDPSRLSGKLTGLAVPFLDWFGRFEVEPWQPDDQRGHSVVVVRRDGEPATGIRAFAMLTRCIPLLFPIWAPVALVASFTQRGDLTTRG